MPHLRLVHENKLTQVAGSATHPAINDFKSQTSTDTNFTITTSPVEGNIAVVAYLPEHNDSITMTVSAGQPVEQSIDNTRWGEARRADLLNVSTTLIYAYKRSSTAVTDNPGLVTYNFTSKIISTTTLANNWQKTIPAGTDQLYITVAVAYSTTTSDNVAITEWSPPVAVSDSLNNFTANIVYLYAVNTSTTSAPTLSTTDTCTYNFQANTLTGSIPANWSASQPVVASNQYLWVRAAAVGSVLETISSTTVEGTSTPTTSLSHNGKYISVYLDNLSQTSTFTVTFSQPVKVSRFIVGNYWSPKYNIPYGISVGYQDLSTQDRLAGGDVYTNPGPRHKTLSFELEYLHESDKFNLFKIFKSIGKVGCVFVSAFPQDPDQEKEQMYSIYGKFAELSQIVFSQYTRYTSSVSIEEF